MLYDADYYLSTIKPDSPMKGGFRLFSTIALTAVALFYLLFPLTQNRKPINLGLDLQGGMHVTLEVGLEALIRELASDKDATFEAVLKTAGASARTQDADVIEAFVNEFEKRDPNGRLSRYFRNQNEGITRRSSNSDIKTYLNKQADAAMEAAIKIVRDQIDRFGVTEPSIVKQGTRRISVELPGVSSAERVRKLLRGTAKLQFRLMGDPNDVNTSLQRIVEFYNVAQTPADTSKTAKADTTKKTPAASAKDNPLLKLLTPMGGVAFGAVNKADTAKVAAMFRRPEVRQLMPTGIVTMWSSQTTGKDNKQYALLAVRDKVELEGSYITDARNEFDQFTNAPKVTLSMDTQGANIWSRLTGANVGKQVAISMDDIVYSYPVIREKIPGGNTSIDGIDSADEAKDLVTVLKSGSLPAPVTIVQERTVGPSLGAASIQAGQWSIIISFVLIAIFMMFYYRTGGMLAVFALILNLTIIFGILAAFGATLTLPGIAGIVLTIGMAVDANVLAFERIREETDTGKAGHAATEAGYRHSLSAIVDSHITTFFTGAILYSFGIGPIKGFAVTLMAGVLTTLFTTLIVTRLITDYWTRDHKHTISYG